MKGDLKIRELFTRVFEPQICFDALPLHAHGSERDDWANDRDVHQIMHAFAEDLPEFPRKRHPFSKLQIKHRNYKYNMRILPVLSVSLYVLHSGLIQGLRLANERLRYFVTPGASLESTLFIHRFAYRIKRDSCKSG